MLNWAWIYQSTDGLWKQFDCIQCMILESKMRKWLNDKSVKLTLKIGTIDFERMIAEVKSKDGIIIR